MRLPELRGDAQVVLAVAGSELIAAHLHPVLGHEHVGGRLGVDAQAQRRAPDQVGDEAHLAAVPGEEPGTGALEALLREHDAVGRAVELRLQRAVGPGDADHLRARRSRPGRSGRPAPRSPASARASPVRISTSPPIPKELMRWSPGRGGRPRPHRLPVIGLGAAALPPARRARPATPSSSSRPSPSRSATGAGAEGERLAERLERAAGAAQEHPRRRGAGDDEIEAAVVVEVRDQQARGSGSETRGRRIDARRPSPPPRPSRPRPDSSERRRPAP